MKAPTLARRLLLVPVALFAFFAGGAVQRVQDQCGPFTDVSPALCPYVLEMYYLGITAGTSPTTYSPDSVVTRGQAAVFVSKGVNQAIARSSRRAAIGQWWRPGSPSTIARTALNSPPVAVASDGSDIWVTHVDGTVSRVRGSDGRVLGTWTGAGNTSDVLVAAGRVFVASADGVLSMIDPTQSPGPATPVASELGTGPVDVAFDGSRFWTAAAQGVSVITPGPTFPWPVQAISLPYFQPLGLTYDGSNIWVTGEFEAIAGEILKLDASGAVLQSVVTGRGPHGPLFDGSSIWVLNIADESITVVQASSGAVLATLTGNGMSGSPRGAAFDGTRVLVSTFAGLSSWSAASLEPAGFVAVNSPLGVCSDGLNFWAALYGSQELGRY